MPKLELSYWGGVIFLIACLVLATIGIWVSYSFIFQDKAAELGLPWSITVPLHLTLLLCTALIICVGAQVAKLFLSQNNESPK